MKIFKELKERLSLLADSLSRNSPFGPLEPPSFGSFKQDRENLRRDFDNIMTDIGVVLKTVKVRPIDVGQYIIEIFISKNRSITTLKLQRLVFYSQAFSLVWDDEPLFVEDFYAQDNGPVVESLRNALKEYYYCPEMILGSDISRLTDNQKNTINEVVEHYGDLTSYDLTVLSKSDQPYKEARLDKSYQPHTI